MNTDKNNFTEIVNAVREAVREELAAHESDRPHVAPGGTQYLTVEDVTQRLQIGTTTLWQLRRDGKIKGFHVGRRVLFRPEDVDALVQGGDSSLIHKQLPGEARMLRPGKNRRGW